LWIALGIALLFALADLWAYPHQLPGFWILKLCYVVLLLACLAFFSRHHLGGVLRRQNEVTCVHVAGCRGQDRPFSPEQQRTPEGIGPLASMAADYTLTVQQLERANRLKSQFVANISHDLCTSINVIRGYADLAMDGEFGEVNPELRETLRRIDQRAAALQNLVRNALELTQLETGEFPASLREIALSDLIADVNAETYLERSSSPLTFEWRVDDDITRIRTDVTKLKLVLRNLISNAFKFTRNGSVSVEGRRHAGGIEFAVRDTGIGIAPEQHEAIFNPFHPADGSRKQLFGGTGLGLHISRRLLETMGGMIGLESEVGRGSVFRVWIPAEVVSSRACEGS
jgi:signal transduction histidine kinase